MFGQTCYCCRTFVFCFLQIPLLLCCAVTNNADRIGGGGVDEPFACSVRGVAFSWICSTFAIRDLFNFVVCTTHVRVNFRVFRLAVSRVALFFFFFFTVHNFEEKRHPSTHMRKIASVDEFKQLLATGSGVDKGLVVHFQADWCAPCGELNAILESSTVPAYAELGVAFAAVDVEQLPELCEAHEVESVPFVMFFRKLPDGSLDRVADVMGAKVDEIETNLVSLFGKGKLSSKADFPSLDDYIRHLLKRDKILVFITGTPSRPRCGFTRKIVGLLEQHGASYSYFDIMSDGEVCERLKTFSNWPTFPQVYVNGELIGGCDVCTQLQEEGELRQALKLD